MKNKIYVYNNSSIKFLTYVKHIILSRNEQINSNYISFLSQEIYILEYNPLAVGMINYEIFQIFHTRCIDKSVYLRYIRK